MVIISGVSKNSGTSKNGWFISWKIPSINGWWFGSTPISGHLHVFPFLDEVWIEMALKIETFESIYEWISYLTTRPNSTNMSLEYLMWYDVQNRILLEFFLDTPVTRFHGFVDKQNANPCVRFAWFTSRIVRSQRRIFGGTVSSWWSNRPTIQGWLKISNKDPRIQETSMIGSKETIGNVGTRKPGVRRSPAKKIKKIWKTLTTSNNNIED